MPGSILNGCTTGGSISSDNAPTLNVPAGAGAGDAYLLAITSNESNSVAAWPSGFTEVALSPNETTYGLSLRAAIRPYDGTEGATFTATLTNYAFWGALCGVIDGISAATVVDIDAVGAYGGFVGSVDLPGGTVTVPGAGHLGIWIGASASTITDAPTMTPPSGFTTPTDGAVVLYADYTLHMAYQASLGAGDISPIGNHTWAAAGPRSALGMALLFAESGGGGGGSSSLPVINTFGL